MAWSSMVRDGYPGGEGVNRFGTFCTAKYSAQMNLINLNLCMISNSFGFLPESFQAIIKNWDADFFKMLSGFLVVVLFWSLLDFWVTIRWICLVSKLVTLLVSQFGVYS